MRRIFRGLLACILVSLAIPAWAQTSLREYSLEIARLPLVETLRELSQQTGLQIGYLPSSSIEENMIVGPLSGRYTAESALTELLAHSGLSFERINARTIAVTSPDAAKSSPRGDRAARMKK